MATITDTNKIENLLEGVLKTLTNFQTKPAQEYLCTKQAAWYLGVSRQRLEIWRCHGGGPKYTKLAQAVRYKKSDLDAFMASRVQHHTSEVNYGQ